MSYRSDVSPTVPVRVFDWHNERLVLFFPLALILFSIYEIASGTKFVSGPKFWLWFVADFVCINGFHYIYTFRLAFTVPAYRNALARHWKKLGLLGIALVCIACWALRAVEPVLIGPLALGNAVFLFYISRFHGVRQTFGISLLYNQLARQSDRLSFEQTQSMRKTERRERIYTYWIVFLSTVSFALAEAKWLERKYLTPLSVVFSVVVAAMVIQLITRYLRIDRQLFRWKAVFLSRMFLLSLNYFSFLAIIGICAIHGIEYYLISKRLLGHAKQQNLEQPKHDSGYLMYGVYFSLLVIVVVGTLLSKNVGLPNLVFDKGWQNHPFVQVAVIGVTGLSILHVYLDGIMFRMSIPEVREQTGHWLLSDPLPLEQGQNKFTGRGELEPERVRIESVV